MVIGICSRANGPFALCFCVTVDGWYLGASTMTGHSLISVVELQKFWLATSDWNHWVQGMSGRDTLSSGPMGMS